MIWPIGKFVYEVKLVKLEKRAGIIFRIYFDLYHLKINVKIKSTFSACTSSLNCRPRNFGRICSNTTRNILADEILDIFMVLESKYFPPDHVEKTPAKDPSECLSQ